MAIFDLNNFNYRRVVKLAPDSFITVNSAFGGRAVTSLNKENAQEIDIQGGIISINSNSTISTPGAGKASIQIVAPEYTGIHSRDNSSDSGYWITLPSGVKIPYVTPMMEIQIFMKGRYLYNQDGVENPTYYRVFWGFVTDVTEEYHDGMNTIAVQCNDMLGWWKYQKLILSPNEWSATVGSPNPESFPTILRGMNHWQVITTLLYETQWKSRDGKATYQFLQTKLSNLYMKPIFGNLPTDAIASLANKMSEYWQKRFNFFGESMKVEMFGLTRKVVVKYDPQGDVIKAATNKSAKDSSLSGTDNASQKNTSPSAAIDDDIGYDYNLLARVLPFSDYDLFGVGGQSLELTKLEIAQKVCEMSHMEFFVDTNGIIIFKPPFYNLDVTKGNIPYYVIETSDVIDYSAGINTEAICTYLEVTAPQIQVMPTFNQIAGVHIDWDLMIQYGLRYQHNNIKYGNDARSLSLIAAAEMTRLNAEANTGSVTIPLRPELRMGYPVYIVHKDVYFYVSGITHSFNFGAGATTSLSLTAKRERVYDFTGELTANLPVKIDDTGAVEDSDYQRTGRVLKGFVQKFVETDELIMDITSEPNRHFADKMARANQDVDDPEKLKRNKLKEDYLRLTGARAGPQYNGAYKLVPAEITNKSLSSTEQNTSISSATGEKSTVMSNQLLMITKDTVPYTDYRGYRHIGAFPYGANMILRDNLLVPDNDSVSAVRDNEAHALVDSKDPGTPSNTLQDTEQIVDRPESDPIQKKYTISTSYTFDETNIVADKVIADVNPNYSKKPASSTSVAINPNPEKKSVIGSGDFFFMEKVKQQ